MMTSEQAKQERDRRLRKSLLSTLDLAKKYSPTRGLSGRNLVVQAESNVVRDMRFEDDAHAMSLIRDLVNKGLAEEELLTRRRGQSFGPEFVVVRITDKGSMLVREQIPVDPDVWDERITDEV